ncbi:hypothetical protein ASD52_06705 [Ensifer sp. Root142]|uniref:DUF2971 domain-containing protein n=1 Tax=Ensifer sp. Root142 TaxID=1736461 RepID=UPI00070D5DDB|nr:DUF2971 domain-containing protein [Ensifer sp. Root142]KQY71366.1 hypothetical protein ASD52_06705 [Ensifer sp. Root142]
MSEHFYRMRTIFAVHETEKAMEVLSGGKRLVHYTPAANAVNILRSGQIWLRNVRLMNDLLEVHHGFNLLQAVTNPSAGTPIEQSIVNLTIAVNTIFPGLAEEATQIFSSHNHNLRHQSFVACLSVHDPVEDRYGRLSMWRSYSANQVGVAIVINPQPLQQFVTNFGVVTSPVYYLREQQVQAMVTQLANNIRSAADYIRTVPRDEVKGWYFHLLRTIATCSKHPGFQEEQEWRILHTRFMDDRAPLLEEVETIGGIPQVVMKLPLRDHPDKNVFGISLPNLIEKVIVGPCQFPWVICDALLLEMNRAGIPDAINKIVVSEIPLRT